MVDRGGERIVPLALDVTDRDSIRAAAGAASDTTVLMDNAGVGSGASQLSDDLTASRDLFETNDRGQLEVTNALVPALEEHRGAMANVLSVLSRLAVADACSASKAAFWSATNAQRLALAGVARGRRETGGIRRQVARGPGPSSRAEGTVPACRVQDTCRWGACGKAPTGVHTLTPHLPGSCCGPPPRACPSRLNRVRPSSQENP